MKGVGNRPFHSIYSQYLPFYLGLGMKKSELRKLVREQLRTRFMFEKENDFQPEPESTEPTNDSSPKNGEPSPHEQALAMGLVDKKFGRYGDPKTGKIVAKVIDGKLVKNDPEDPEERRQAPEPAKSGFNYEDPYGEDYPKPKGQLGAVPPTFAPVNPPNADAYADSAAPILPNNSGRPTKYNQKDISGQQGVSRRDALSKDERDGYSNGGAGTFKGSVPTDGALVRTSQDGSSASWSPDGPLDKPDVDISREREQASRLAGNMSKKYGNADKALEVAKRNRERVEQEFNALQQHNTNSSPERLKKLEDMQKIIDKLTWAEEALLKQRDGGKVEENVTSSKLGSLVSEEIFALLESSASEQAKKLGLIGKGWGRYADPSTGQIVAKSVNGKLVRTSDIGDEKSVPEDDGREDDLNPDTSKEMDSLFNMFGHEKKHYNSSATKTPMHSRVRPGWNKGMGKEVEVEFDANADQTVAELLKKVGDPKKLMKWLIKKFKTATPKGKKRIAQYIGILKKLEDVNPADVQGGDQIALPPAV